MHDRIRPAIGAFACIVLGLVSRACPVGLRVWDKSFGDIIYPVMFGFLIRVARPLTARRTVGAWSFAICFGLELFQLTGIPAMFPRVLRFLFGTSFAWHDVACDVIGALIITRLLALEWWSPPRA